MTTATQVTQDESHPEKQVNLNDFTPSAKIPGKYPDLFTPEQWSWKVAQRKHNGLAPAFRKIGKGLYVHDPTLAQCMNEQLAD